MNLKRKSLRNKNEILGCKHLHLRLLQTKKTANRKRRSHERPSKKIVSNISQGKEQVTTTVVHLSEIVNILKNGMPQDQLTQIILGLFMLNNVRIMDVTKDEYFAGAELGEDLKLEPNDALAVDIMRQNEIAEIFTFDEHFINIAGIIKLPIV
jgi:predicted nucleic acid-binding protein